MPRLAHNMTFSRGIGTPVIGVLCLLSFSACHDNGDKAMVDMLNGRSYACHYSSLDSTMAYAAKAYKLAGDYGDGRAEALNNMAFVHIARMQYETADSMLSAIDGHTDNQVELLVADVQMMRLCQRMSANRRFYDYRESAMHRLQRIKEEPSELSSHLKSRMVYAESEMAIVTSTYYYYVGLQQESADAILSIDQNVVKQDTAQYLNYLYNIGAGGVISAQSAEEVSQREFEHLMRCLLLARKTENLYFEANSMQSIADHLLDRTTGPTIYNNNPAAMRLLTPFTLSRDELAGAVAVEALDKFYAYGDIYQIAGAYRSLASCYMGIGDYLSAIDNLEAALSDSVINKAPDLVASIREQMSVAYSAIDDKPSSDYNRNIYLDLQEETRQDRQLESRAAMLDKTSAQLNILMWGVAAAITVLVALLWVFNLLYRRRNIDEETQRLLEPLRQWSLHNSQLMEQRRQQYEETMEEMETCRLHIDDNEKRILEQRARISLATSILPLIDRIMHEVKMLTSRSEADDVCRYRRQYVSELASQINDNNDLLTQWIKLSEGRLSIKVTSFRLDDLFNIIAKNRTTFNAKGVELDIRSTDAVVKADRILTLFMINTLADNALKFTDKGGRVAIYAKTIGQCVEVSVEDTGCGLTEQQAATIFNHKVSNGHGFGLMNCRGIIEKYKKTSPKFACSLLSVESRVGQGSRFFFRLPSGVARTLMVLLLPLVALSPMSAQVSAYMKKAAQYADSAYYSNIAGTYSETVRYADSCRVCLNNLYSSQRPHGANLLKAMGNTTMMPPEVQWLHDGIDVDFHVILDMRNECAVAALALHDWELYRYNNHVYTRLFNQLSADGTLADYCAMMRSSQSNKTVAVIVLILILLSILPAYYMLYYRHILYFRHCEERIGRINEVINGDGTIRQKLNATHRLSGDDFPEQLRTVVETIVATLTEAERQHHKMADDMEMLRDQLNKAEYENSNLHVCNSILDNCLSTLKHETMYYPSRIKQMMEKSSVEDVAELVEYYRNIYSMLCLQATSQLGKVAIQMRKTPLHAVLGTMPCSGDTDSVLLCNETLVRHLFELLKSQTADGNIVVGASRLQSGYLLVSVAMPSFVHAKQSLPLLFVPGTSATIPFLLCRQIIRDHSESTNRRGCGISAREGDGGIAVVEFTLPLAEPSSITNPSPAVP